MTPRRAHALEAGLGHRFAAARAPARSRSRIARSPPTTPNNETLEFLGDAVLALAMSDLLMAPLPGGARGRAVEDARRRS